MEQKKTKIVATIGPASNSEETIQQLLDKGVNVFRFNFSHVDHETHGRIFDRVRNVSEDVGIMLDTKGPEIRLREVEEGTEIESGDTIEISQEKDLGDSRTLTVNHEGLIESLDDGDKLLIDDGKIVLSVEEVGDTAVCKVESGGPIESRKSVNVPGKDLGLSAPTEKDIEDIIFGAEKGFDFVAVSFVKQAKDIHEIRRLLEEHNSEADIIAKIEHLKAVENFEQILEASDGIMVARGDLGVEANPSKVPIIQKEQIKKANKASKPVITATQMLESMTENPRATRAEASDVANAVLDGTDAVMLSGETAMGSYPVKAVEFMSDTIIEVEETINGKIHHTIKEESNSVPEIISKNVWQAARDTDARFIVANTSSGSTARNISKYRPNQNIVAFTDSENVKRKLNLVWGVKPFYTEFSETVRGMVKSSTEDLLAGGFVDPEDTLVLTAGIPIGVPGTTNMMEIRDVEDILEH